MGRRTLRDWILRPLMDLNAIKRRQEAIKVFVEAGTERAELLDLLAGTRDVERSLSRLALGTGAPTDLAAIRDTLRIIPGIKDIQVDEPVKSIMNTLPDLDELKNYLDSALEENLPRNFGAWPVIRSSFNEELEKWREIFS